MNRTTSSSTIDDRSIDTLNSLLKGEISATETYRQAIEKLDDQRLLPLQDNLECHGRRVIALSTRISAMGGKPAQGSGLWGAFARLVEGGAKVFGKDAAIAALEEGEDRGLADYRKCLTDLDPVSRRLVEDELFPAQMGTHRVMSELKKGRTVPTRTGGTRSALLFAVALGVGFLAGCHDERKVTLNEVTPAARATIAQVAGSGEIKKIEEERDDGRVCYHVVVSHDGKETKHTIDEAGKLKD